MSRRTPDAGTLIAFLRTIMAPGFCTEFAVFSADMGRNGFLGPSRYRTTWAGWFDDPARIVAAANHLLVDPEAGQGVSAYVTINPVQPDMMAMSAGLARVESRTRDKNIDRIDFIYIDIDTRRPNEKLSATQEELDHAVAIRDRILADHPAIKATAIWGISGNGCWILVFVGGLPNDAGTHGLVTSFLTTLAWTYGRKEGDGPAWVDTLTSNPARVCCLPGTWKCKGAHTEERPWRLVTIDTPHVPGEPIPLVPFDLASWVAAHPPLPPSHSGPPRQRVLPAPNGHVGPDDVLDRARKLLGRIGPAVSGQGGHAKTFEAACALVKGYDLPVPEARNLLAEWNQTCQPPWSEGELEHKLEEADARPDREPRGYLIRQSHAPQQVNGHMPVVIADRPAPREPDPRAPDDPHRLAELFLDDHFTHHDRKTLVYFREEWHHWDGAAYRPVRESELRAILTRTIGVEFAELFQEALARYAAAVAAGNKEAIKKGPPSSRPVTTGLISNVIQALSGMCLVMEDPDAPSTRWIGDHPRDWSPSDLLCVRNGIVHLPSLLDRKDVYMIDPTPNLFNSHSFRDDFDPGAPEPSGWLAFLRELWDDDDASIGLLQEWMGYLLTPDTSQQKMMILIGPPRAGKGVISNVITSLVGQKNTINPTLASLADTFGLQGYDTKNLAIVSDARISGRTDTAIVVERLLSITGEGDITVGRKHLPSITTRLPTRWMIVSNELPRLIDQSNAITSRMLFLRLVRSFLGREDATLTRRLLAEIPGILNWAIAGWGRLRLRGRFSEGGATADIREAMGSLASPVSDFLFECVRVEAGALVPCPELYELWRSWQQQQGREWTGTAEEFGRILRAACPSVEKKRRRLGGKLVYHYVGLRLLEDWEYNGLDDAGRPDTESGTDDPDNSPPSGHVLY